MRETRITIISLAIAGYRSAVIYLSLSARFFISIDFINSFVQRVAVQEQLSRDAEICLLSGTRSIHANIDTSGVESFRLRINARNLSRVTKKQR